MARYGTARRPLRLGGERDLDRLVSRRQEHPLTAVLRDDGDQCLAHASGLRLRLDVRAGDRGARRNADSIAIAHRGLSRFAPLTNREVDGVASEINDGFDPDHRLTWL